MNTRAAAVERAYGRSIFSSFYAVWSAGGAVAALLTAATTRLGWSTSEILALQAAIVLAPAATVHSHVLRETASPDAGAVRLRPGAWRGTGPPGAVLLIAYVVDSTVSAWSTVYVHRALGASLPITPLAYAAYQAGTIAGRDSSAGSAPAWSCGWRPR
ncbi:hypothetical protein ACFUEN_05645 [Streptomyces griseorubiginosus]|uniref:hypothetical protein n=1 Tax=Streptomyces griseorubiginosus TaxID=67304 RepID=UPI0036377D50